VHVGAKPREKDGTQPVEPQIEAWLARSCPHRSACRRRRLAGLAACRLDGVSRHLRRGTGCAACEPAALHDMQHAARHQTHCTQEPARHAAHACSTCMQHTHAAHALHDMQHAARHQAHCTQEPARHAAHACSTRMQHTHAAHDIKHAARSTQHARPRKSLHDMKHDMQHTHDMQHAARAHALHKHSARAHALHKHSARAHGHTARNTAHLCSSNPGARSPLGTPCISNCVGCKRVEPAPSHRATGTPSAGARCWDSICRRHPTPANRPAPGHLASATASQSNCKLYRQSDGASQPVKLYRRQSARQIISAPVSPSNHLGASQPVKSSRRQSARQIISTAVNHANHLDGSQPCKSSRRQSATQMMTSHGRRGE
jgi:hypothetical protein